MNAPIKLSGFKNAGAIQDSMESATRKTVLGKIRAMGPVTLSSLCHEVKEQQHPEPKDIKYAVVIALNQLCKLGLVELYDTGDAWDVV